MRVLLLFVYASIVSAQDPREIVRRSVELDRKYQTLLRQYTYTERQDDREIDGAGAVKGHKTRTWDVTLLEGSPYRRLIARDDKPLPPDEERKEREKLAASNEQRRKETPAQRDARIADWERRQQRQREPAQELADAFDFRILREQSVDGVAVWVIEGTPRRGYNPRTRAAHFFPKLRGQLWITKADYRWVRIEFEAMDTISIGGFLARFAKGSRIAVEQTLVNGEVWLPKRVAVDASARIVFVKKMRANLEITYANYRKFQADSRIVAVEAKP
jgi:hypothetical protein